MSITHLYHKIRFAILRKRIKKNPYIGQEESHGIYLYKKDGYSINYRIIKLPGGEVQIEWVSHRRRLNAYEERIRRIKQGLLDFWHYQKWLFFFRPSIFFLLLVSILFFYSEVMEKQETKIARLKWMIASILTINPRDVQYIGDGWLEISGQRTTAVDKIGEPIRYTFNPFRWFFFSEGGFLTRWRGRPYGYVTHPIVYNDKGEVWINKEGTWRHGRIDGKTIGWEAPQGTGIRAGKVAGHEISTPEKRLFLPDIEKK